MDLGRDITKLLSSKDMVVMGGKDNDVASLDSSISLWNLHYPLTHPVVVDWMALIQRSVRRQEEQGDDNQHLRNLIKVGKLSAVVRMQKEWFGNDMATVIRTYNDNNGNNTIQKAAENICQRFAPACEE